MFVYIIAENISKYFDWNRFLMGGHWSVTLDGIFFKADKIKAVQCTFHIYVGGL